MLSTDAWLRVICSLMVNAVLFGVGAIAVLSIPALDQHAKYLIPLVIILNSVVTIPISAFLAKRMRLRNWGKSAWKKVDRISG
ncbi:hypothetical protein RMS29_015370 [Agrobacterium rosae]|uniref:Uncharacterized protein n=1 Tax=Agrobacterium rosae TaxID=1972867 RepID=A0AAW9FQH2_9HYPH|nr:hypothetical protein [Agrobacterium rosae]MDX8305758.1 hypothetical protein [Agrobacterium rosae]MDX8332904.1 hypothetical protein [Agrobacterium rosae]